MLGSPWYDDWYEMAGQILMPWRYHEFQAMWYHQISEERKYCAIEMMINQRHDDPNRSFHDSCFIRFASMSRLPCFDTCMRFLKKFISYFTKIFWSIELVAPSKIAESFEICNDLRSPLPMYSSVLKYSNSIA